MLYRGTGIATSHPHSPPIEILLSGALMRAGYSGTRAPGSCLFASTSIEQAERYASDDDRGSLLGIEPLPGAIVSWAHDRFDMLLDFEGYLRRLQWGDEVPSHAMPRSTASFLRDVQGDIGVFETYLTLGRMKAVCLALAAAFVSTRDIREFRLDDDRDLEEVLDGHHGEVWISGPVETTLLRSGPRLRSPSP